MPAIQSAPPSQGHNSNRAKEVPKPFLHEVIVSVISRNSLPARKANQDAF